MRMLARLVLGLFVLKAAVASPRFARQVELDSYESSNYDEGPDNLNNYDYDNRLTIDEPRIEIGTLAPPDYYDPAIPEQEEEEEEKEDLSPKPQLIPQGSGESGLLMGPNTQGEEELRLSPIDILPISGDNDCSTGSRDFDGSGSLRVSCSEKHLGSGGSGGSGVIGSGGSGESVDIVSGDSGDSADIVSGASGDSVDIVSGASGDSVDIVSGASGDSVDIVSGASGDSVDIVSGASGDSVDIVSGDSGDSVDIVSGASGDSRDIVSGDSGDSVDIVSGDSGHSGDIVSGDSGISREIVSGDFGISGDIVSGDSGISGEIVSGDFGISGDLVSGDSEVSGDLVSGESGVSGDLVSGDSEVSGDLVSGESGISGDLVSGELGVSGDLVSGESGVSGDLASGESGVSGDLISGESGVSGDLVSEESGVSGDLVSEESGVSGDLVSGESGVSGDLVSGESEVSGDLVSGDSGSVMITGEEELPPISVTTPPEESGDRDVSGAPESGDSGSSEPEVTLIPVTEEDEWFLPSPTPPQESGGEVEKGMPTCLLCTCLGSSVYCDDVKLTSVPPLPKETTHFYARYNQITKINKGDFAQMNKLKRIDLTANAIMSVADNAFSALPVLEELLLRENSLAHLPALPNTMTLIDGSHNNIGASGIHKEAFKDMAGLQYLYLDDNQINHIPVPLPDSLRSLHLQRNNIQMMHEDTFCNLKDFNYIRNALEDIRLDGNPINLSNTPQAYVCLPRVPIGALI